MMKAFPDTATATPGMVVGHAYWSTELSSCFHLKGQWLNLLCISSHTPSAPHSLHHHSSLTRTLEHLRCRVIPPTTPTYLLTRASASVLELFSLFLFGYGALAVGLRYGYYGKHRLVLGPNSSRMMKTSSLFVEQVQVKDKANNQGILLYGFKERPELDLEANWTVSNHLFVDSYDRRGFSMWLNKGSRIWMAWEVTHGGQSNEDMLVVLIKGEQNLKELQRYYPGSHINPGDTGEGNRKAEYTVAEDDSYYFGVVNLTPRTMVMLMKVNVTSKVYDISRATNICSTTDGLCKLELHLPSTCYYVLTTPNTDVPITLWQVELSFVARLVSYLVITGFVMVIVYMVLKYLGACDSEQTLQVQIQTAATETDPILPRKEMPCTYGTNEEEPESSSSCSSEDLYDGKICVICYDERRNCFFTPCGHSATCYTCAKRIMEEENKVCPICRRLIHKLRRLFRSRDDPQSALGKVEENLNCEQNN